MVRVVLADDETAACDQLKRIIGEVSSDAVEIVGIVHDTAQAEQLVLELKPDAVFLDIEMPGENAMQFLERISPFSFQVIFVTAYDEYAVKAFRLNAVDYILKPVSNAEIKGAVEKLVMRQNSMQVSVETANYYRFISEQINQGGSAQKIRFRSGNSLEIVAIADLYYIEAQRSYSRIVFNANGRKKEITMSQALTEYESLLPADRFYRIHKSYLVNCSHITHIITNPVIEAVVNNGIRLPVGRRRYAALLNFLSEHHFISKKA